MTPRTPTRRRRVWAAVLAVSASSLWGPAGAQEGAPTAPDSSEHAVPLDDEGASHGLSDDPHADLAAARAALQDAERALSGGTLSALDLEVAVDRIGAAIPTLSRHHAAATALHERARLDSELLTGLLYRLEREAASPSPIVRNSFHSGPRHRLLVVLGAAIEHRQATATRARQSAATAGAQLTEATHAVEDVRRLLDRRLAELREIRAATPQLEREIEVLEGAVAARERLGSVSGSDIPFMAFDAYLVAARTASVTVPGCGLDWATLAAIGRIESGHGTIGGNQLDPDGRTETPIVGRALDGTNGTRHIPDTDGGFWDGDIQYDRAVGPMQFIPSTWRGWARDGNFDGVEDIHNIYDATAAAAAYLCAAGEMSTAQGWRSRVLAYNRSDAYVDAVMDITQQYQALGLMDR